MKKIFVILLIFLVLLIGSTIVIYLLFTNSQYIKNIIPISITTTSTTTITTEVTTRPVVFSKKINENIIDILNSYSELNNIIVNANIEIPLTNGFIPQGITYYNDNFLLIGYYEYGRNSKCFVIDLEGNIINEVTLDTNSHVGAISYDEVNDLLWIPDNNGILNAYGAKEFLYADSVNYLYKFDYVSDGLDDYIYYNKRNIAFVTIDDNYIYIGNFYKTKKSLVKKYLIKNEDTLKLEYVDQFLVPPRTQSISFIDFNNEKYMLFSNSFNRRTTSYLETYKYDENVDDYNGLNIKRISMPPMSEQVTVKEEYAFIIFESGANKYYNALDKIKYICILDINKLLE